MYPILGHIGPLTLRSFGLMMAIAFAASLYLAARRAPRLGIPPDHVFDLSLWLIGAGLVGSRALYVILEWDQFAPDPISIVKPPYAGLVWYGGVLLAAPVAWWRITSRGWSFALFADLLAPSVAVGHAIGRVGCLLHGCCFGSVCDAPWGVVYPEGSPGFDAHGASPLHPAQLYEAGLCVLLALALIRWTPKRTFDGQIFAVFLVAETAIRFTVEFFRGDDRGTIGSEAISPSQAIALVGAAAGVALYLRWRTHRRTG